MTDLDQLTSDVRALIPIFDAMGLEIVAAEPGRAVASLPAAPNMNHFGAMYAGCLYSVAEVLGGVLARSSFPMDEGFFPLVKHSEISFLRPATTGVRATATLSPDEIDRALATAREQGRAEFRLHAEVTDERGEVVATTEGVYQLRRL